MSYEVVKEKEVKRNNPVLRGLYADPDIAQFEDSYYIYPTTDGYSGWSGTQFKVFSSKDLVQWKEEGIILDVATGDVTWAVGSAWAPAIAVKNNNYYFYFCAKREDGASCIGVASSKSPVGPFVATSEPILTPEIINQYNISMWQTIDPSVFIDNDGTPYLFFGNGAPAVVQLNEDMISIKPETMKQLSGAHDFREAITVTKRSGRYHFTWSCDDTGNENYHVNYGISDNIYGPIEYKYTILEKDVEQDILGTGHHCVLKITEKDEYYIAYHRFGTPLKNYPDEKGCHREACIDRLEFSEEGFMMPVKVTN
jgi:beta-xylosidase